MRFDDFLDRLRLVRMGGLWIELAVLAGCLALAWGLSRWSGRGQPRDSIWFGERTFDGLLFPLLSLVFVDLARRVMLDHQVVVVLRIAVSVFASLVAIRLIARVLRAVFPASALVGLVERTVSWIAWAGAVLWIVGLLPPVLAELDRVTLAFGKDRVSLRTIMEGTLSAGLVMVIALWVAATIEKRILREAVSDLSMRKVASNAIRAFLLLVGLLFALSAVGVDLTALSVLGGALGVGLGFGLQKLAANYVSGFVILLERSIRIGDNVKIDSFEGRITDIKTRYTLVRAGNGREAIVPNESLITSRVENLSLADRKFNITTAIVVGYRSEVAQVQAILVAAATAQPRVMTEPAPVAFLTTFTPDGIEFTLHFWIADPDKGKDNVRAARIEIPFAQRVLRVESLPRDFTAGQEAPL